MLDLKKLEEKLDQALESETTESLSSWLFSKRSNNFLAQLGDGDFSTLKSPLFQKYSTVESALIIEVTANLKVKPNCHNLLLAA